MLPWLETDAANAFARRASRRTYHPGQIVYLQQDYGQEMYRVISGSVRLTIRRADGREAAFLFFGPGDCFGVSSLVDDAPRPQTAESLAGVELDVLARPAFEEMIAQHPSFARAVMILLARQMRIVSQFYERHSLTSLASRVASRLLEVAVREPGADAALVARLPQAELATMVGASRQSVNKMLQRYQRRGLIRLAKGAVQILDPRALFEAVDSMESEIDA